MSPRAPRQKPAISTHVRCDRTDRYEVKNGVHLYDWCPLCGDRIEKGENHEIILDIRD